MHGCPGTYAACTTVCVDRGRGALVVIEHVPVDVCDVCGDTLFQPKTLRHREALRQTAPSPTRTVPVYAYA
jgi:YgiT-type zinc finger domain-containing protein